MRKTAILFLFVLASCRVFLSFHPACAHFGMIIPSDSMVMQGEERTLRLLISFSHPFEGIGMNMHKPKEVAVRAGGANHSLAGDLAETRVMGHNGWEAAYTVKRPGSHIFTCEPAPYWEPAEDCYIIHYTKTVVGAFGDPEGWDEDLGLRAEIVPLTRPFGLYAGNVFQGVVKVNGKPVPFADVEVEYYNRKGRVKTPTVYMITQAIKADRNGIFTYAAPRAGWWGFAALVSAQEKIPFEGEDKDVELGAVIWVEFHDWMEN